ncbi:MAG: RluA family pseudouridine synthase [Wujia sp.]
MKELQVSAKDAGQRLNKYIMKYLNQAPSSFVYKMLRKKNITRNGKKAAGDEILVENDKICLFLSDETIEKFRSAKTETALQNNIQSNNQSQNASTMRKLQILYEDDDILAVHKPAGVLSQKSQKQDYSINEQIVDYCLTHGKITKEAFETFTPSVCNRLDRNTSGIILAGITLQGSRMLSKALKDRSFDKYYFTIVKGTMKKPIHDVAYLKKDCDRNHSHVYRTPEEAGDCSKIETAFTPISVHGDYSLLRVKLYTGKSHQIRAHLKSLGLFMLGDGKYGDETVNRMLRNRFHIKHQLLHAGMVRFPDGTVIKDPLPDYFLEIAKELKLTITDIM